VKYFFDNCISYRYAEMLEALGVEAVALREQFSEHIQDPALFESLKGTGVVFVSSDTSQTTRSHEARALREAGITAIFFGPFWGKMQFWDQAVWLMRRWPLIDGFCCGVDLGTCAEIKQNGRARVISL
jgi:hypothetical protein